MFGGLIQNALATGKFEFSATVRTAYNQALSLRFEAAQSTLNALKSAESDNLMPIFVENYIDCFKIFIGESESELRQLEPNRDKRIALLKKGDPSSPYLRYTQAQTRLLWAMSRLKFNEYVTAMREVAAAYSDLKENQRLFPNFMPNQQGLGILHIIASNIPDNYKGMIKFFSGVEGSMQQGQAELENVIQYAQKKDYPFEQEALIMYGLLMSHIGNQQETAWKTLNTARFKTQENPLACLALSNIALKTAHNDRAIEILSQNFDPDNHYPFWYLQYNLGLAKLYRGDADAHSYLLQYVQNFKGKNYIKECYQKLAWKALLDNDLNNYKNYISLCQSKGSTYMEGDKAALKEAKSEQIPDKTLLRARLYFDGGYYNKALTMLQSKKVSDFNAEYLRLEYQYRFARVYQQLGRQQEAVDLFYKILQEGRNQPYYYACAAALQMGMIYESTRQWADSRKYYQICLEINPSEHANGLHFKAKAGLNRLKKT